MNISIIHKCSRKGTLLFEWVNVMLEMGPNTTTQKQNKEFPEWDQHVFQSVLFKTSIIPLIQAKYRPLSFDQIQLVNTKIQQYSVYLCPHFWN
jgi:hypothetical protein